jgi:hypothetical protein
MRLKLSAGLLCSLLALPAYAGEWRVGPGIMGVTGVDDVSDIYEENFNNTNPFIELEVKFTIPVGLSVQGTYTWDSGVRMDMGLGPMFFLADTGDGDVDTGLEHTEVPISATVGYTFMPGSNVSPYVRAGIVHHVASGDYVEGSSPGLLGAVGVEFLRNRFCMVALEIAFDGATVELERYTRIGNGPVRRRTEDVRTYGTVFGVFVKF